MLFKKIFVLLAFASPCKSTASSTKVNGSNIEHVVFGLNISFNSRLHTHTHTHIYIYIYIYLFVHIYTYA